MIRLWLRPTDSSVHCINTRPAVVSFIKSFDESTDYWWIYFLYNNNTSKNNNRAINWIIFYSRQTVTSASWFDEFCILTSKSIVIVTERDPAVAHEDNNSMLSKEYTNKYTLITKAQNQPSHSIINCASRGLRESQSFRPKPIYPANSVLHCFPGF